MAAIFSIILGIVQLLIGLRFVFLLLGANPDSAFVAWVYDLSTPLVTPFAGIFGQSAVITQGAVVASVFEWASLLAMLVYGIIGSILIRLTSGVVRRA